VSAMIHPVTFDSEVDCWCADIDLSPLVQSSYFPFVRLGLARYQANTVNPEDRLSPVIVSEPIQLLAQRDLTVRRSAGLAVVTVSGPAPGGSRTTVINAELQVFEGSAAAAGDALIGPTGWRTIARRAGGVGSDLNLDIPQAQGRSLRICVTEAESYPSAGSTSADAPTRLVYADTISI
jgi:hypothetical protein